MSSVPETKPRSSRFEARIRSESLALLRRAAEMDGRSLSDFVIAAAEEKARRTIEDAHRVMISPAEQRAFVDLLIDPPRPNPALIRARAAHEHLIGKP